MTIKFKNEKLEMKNFEAKRDIFTNLIKEGAEQDKQDSAYIDMVNAMATDVMESAERVADDKFNELNSYSNKGLSAEEVKFFNTVSTEVGTKEETLLPQTTIDRIFDDMIAEHPLFQEIKLKSAGLRLKILKSTTTGTAVWGKIFGDIKGQLDAAFSEEDISQNKLTAFVVVPKDIEDHGPVWIEKFIRLQITEAFAVMLEAAIVAGDGNEKPVGLNRQVQEGVSISAGVYPVKVAETAPLTFADPVTTVRELTSVMKLHSIKEDGKAVNVSGKVILLVNPQDAWDIKTQYTHLNSVGVYVTALPFNLKVVESEFVTAKTVISLVPSRYEAYVGGGIDIREFTQTLALEDCTLYTAKQFAYGKAQDNKVSAVHTLAIPPVV